jgi:catechol 2,3-dioxygenase-like lactoylglutathione lyase family enzyme
MDHVGVVVEDLEAASEFFLALGLERQGQGSVGGDWVDRIVGLEGVEAELVMLQAPEGQGRLELVRFDAPPAVDGNSNAPSNALGIRHLSFVVDDVDTAVDSVRAHGGELVGEIEQYGDVYRLCYVRGPEGIIVELAEPIGS